jgi:UDP-N-acetylglucosamine 2-epimerase (non-hydrolysing)
VHRLLVAFGTRPEAVKMSPVALAAVESGRYDVRVVVTAQHREMLDQVLDAFGVVPDHDLDLFAGGQTLGAFTSRAMQEIEPVLAVERPDLLLVQGDTTTTFVGALAAFYAGIPVGHVEAGLRTGDVTRPFPEEMNRRLVTAIATLHFAPTRLAADNLLAEHVDPARVFVTGNTVVDALQRPLVPGAAAGAPALDPDRPVLVVTAHRRESWDEGMGELGAALAAVAAQRPDLQVVFPIHRNPVVRDAIEPAVAGCANVQVIEPLPYGPFVDLLRRATVVLTDSGGIQEEAPSLGVPVLVFREVTERPEAVAAGTARLVGVQRAGIVDAVLELVGDAALRARMTAVANPYGDGHACDRILRAIDHHLGLAPGPPEPFAPAGS